MEEGPEQPTWWDASLTRTLRSVLHSYPLHELKLHDSRRHAADLAHYNALTIAVKIIDAIIENTGLETEHDRETLTEALYPLLAQMDAGAELEPDVNRHRRIVHAVLGQLRNDANQRRQFQIEYEHFDRQGRPVRAPLTFWLVRDTHHPSGRVVLQLSTAAKNLFFSALDLDIENQQVATQAMLDYQLRKGKLEEARQLAEKAERLSREYAQKIRQLVHDAQRDLDKVQWETEVPLVIAGAVEHIDLRLPVEEAIVAQADEKLTETTIESQAVSLAAVREKVKACQQRHVELHQVLIGVEKVFLDAQRIQRFNPRPPRYYPDLHAEVLLPALKATARSVETELLPLVQDFLPARAPRVFSLLDLVEWQLQPKKEYVPPDHTVTEPELRDIDQGPLKYPKEVRDRAEAILARLESEVTLSELLALAEAEAATPDVLDVIVYLALHYYAPEDDETTPFFVEKKAGRRIESSRFYGDELLIRPKEAVENA